MQTELMTQLVEFLKKIQGHETAQLHCILTEDGNVTTFGDATNADIIRMIYSLTKSARDRLNMCPCENCVLATNILSAFQLTIHEVFVEDKKPERMN
jgi:hypothetical protein